MWTSVKALGLIASAACGLLLSANASAVVKVDKGFLIADPSRTVQDPIDGVVLGEDSSGAIVQLFSGEESVQLHKAGYECSAPILFLESGRYRRLCGYVDRRPSKTPGSDADCPKGQKMCATGTMGGAKCVPKSHVCAIGCPGDPWAVFCDRVRR